MGGAESKTRQRARRHSGKLTERPSPPGKPQLVPSDKHSPEPDVVTIRWEPPVYDGGSRITGYLVEHRRTGSPHWVRSWPGPVRLPELTLSGLEPGWRYQFRVSAQNAVGFSEPGDLSDLLTVTLQRTAASAPFFVRELQDTTALENEKAELTVLVRGTPTPTLAWFKDGVEVFSSRSYRVVTDNETSTLIIHQASLADEGEIKCSATNKVGYTVTRAKLIIESPPSIRLPRQYEEGLLFEKDEVIRLKVSVAGKPVPVVTWALNGEPVPGGGRYEASHSERYATLRVGEARRSDRGEYTVRAVNRLGEDIASFLVTVADRPMPPGRAKVVMTLGRSVTLSWTAPEDDGGCKIGNYIVEYFRVGWNMWLKAATCRQLTTTLGELIEGSEYKFRVKAENPYGVSEPGQESDVVFIPDPKRGLLEPPEHKPGVTETSMDVWLEDKKRAISPSPSPIDEQYGERKTKKKRGPPQSPQLQRSKDKELGQERHSMMSEDSMSPPPTPEDSRPIIPKRRGRADKIDAMEEVQEERELTKKLEERRKVEEFKKLEELRKLEDERKAEEHRRAEEAKKREEEAKKKEELMKTDQKKRRRKEQLLPPQTPRSEDERDPLHGSSEFMLVLLPHSRDTTEERETSKRELFESAMALEGDDIAPPMSLSAPELGSGGPPEPPPVRSAFSSSELLHERAMARFYQDMAQEEAETVLRRRNSVQRRRSFERRSREVPEVAGSLQDIASAAKTVKDKEEKKPKIEETAPLSPKSPRATIVHGVLTSEKVEPRLLPIVRSEKKSFSKDSMDSIMSTEDLHRKVLVQQSSGEDMEYEDSSFDEDEEDEYDEEEEEVTDEVIGEEVDEELDEEEDEDKSYENRSSLYTTSESEEEAQYSYSLEEDTYHPTAVNIKYDEDTLISAYEGRGPLILGSVSQPSTSSMAARFMDFDVDSNNQAGTSGDVKLKPILKRPSDVNDNKNGESTENGQDKPDYKPRPMSSPEKRFEPNFSSAMPKPILKVRAPSQERLSPVSQRKVAPVAEVEPELNFKYSSRSNLDDLSDYESSTKKKHVRIEEPKDGLQDSPEKRVESNRSGFKAMQRSDSLGEDEADAARVLISHYSDIVAEYSRTKRPPKRVLYLDYEALKAAAEKEEENMPVPEITINEPEPELESEPTLEIKPELESEPSSKAKVEEEIETKHSFMHKSVDHRFTELRGKEQPAERLTVHFESFVEDNLVLKDSNLKPQDKVRDKSPSSLKKRSASPRKRERSVSRDRFKSDMKEKDKVMKEFFFDKTAITRTPSPTLLSRPVTPTEKKVHSYFDFMMDLSLFILACWLYLFKDERLSIPVLFLMVYRQAHEAFQRKMEAIRNKMEVVQRKIPKRILFWRKN